MADFIKQNGGEIILNTSVKEIHKSENKIISLKTINVETNEEKIIDGDLFVSSMPIKDFLTNMNDVPNDIRETAQRLVYRDFIFVNYVVSKINLKNNTDCPTVNNIAPDSWIYLQDNGITAGRLDIMNNFSPYIIKNYKDEVVINMEYFCNENDKFWNTNDEDLVKFGIQELKKLNVLDYDDIKSSRVVRVKKPTLHTLELMTILIK